MDLREIFQYDSSKSLKSTENCVFLGAMLCYFFLCPEEKHTKLFHIEFFSAIKL